MVVGDVVMVTIDVKCRRKNRLKQKKILKTFLNAIIMFIIVSVTAAWLIAENRLKIALKYSNGLHLCLHFYNKKNIQNNFINVKNLTIMKNESRF